MSRAGRTALLVLALGLTTGTAAADSAVRPPGGAAAGAGAGAPAGYDVLPTGGGLVDCGCTGGARARARIELGLIPGHPPQDVPEITPTDH